MSDCDSVISSAFSVGFEAVEVAGVEDDDAEVEDPEGAVVVEVCRLMMVVVVVDVMVAGVGAGVG